MNAPQSTDLETPCTLEFLRHIQGKLADSGSPAAPMVKWAGDEIERLRADATRYRWLRARIAATIIQRIDPQERDLRAEKLDEMIDSRRAS